jgi:hypothetical protein
MKICCDYACGLAHIDHPALILELDRQFSGIIQISSAPLRNALSVPGR